MLFPFKVILLALKPVSKTADIWDLRDIINLLVSAGLFGGGYVIKEWVSFDWFNESYIALFSAVLLFIAALKLQRKTDAYEAKTPCIVFQDGGVAQGLIGKTRQNVQGTIEIDRENVVSFTVYFVYIFVKNDPSGYRSRERIAEKAVPIIDIYDPQELNKPYVSFWGRWAERQQVGARPSHVPIEDLMEIDLPPNGLPHRIQFALKHDKDVDMYGYNNESHRLSVDGRYDNYRLPLNKFYVRVSLKAIGLKNKPICWYEVTNGGANIKPSIKQLSKKEIKALGC